MVTPDAKTLDLADVLSGIALPEDSVQVLFSETLALAVHEAEEAVKAIEASGDEKAIGKAQKEFEKILKEVKGSLYKVTFKALPEEVSSAIREDVNKRFPDKVNFLGQPEPNPAGDREYLRAMWRAHIVRVESADGGVLSLDEGVVDTLYQRLGTLAHRTINNGIGRLNSGASAGFELAVKELGFL